MGIKMNAVRCSEPDSAGGVSVSGCFLPQCSKIIKYITFRFTPYNSVHDAVSCRIKGVSNYGLVCTGPYDNQWRCFSSDPMWYNGTIAYVKVTRVDIEYMDGTTESIPGSEIVIDNSGGCYVATTVYGSYDCPQVWTLRRYRDNTLAKTCMGRAFIRTYYAISPTLVKWFGHTEWFKNMWKGKLDRMVANLNAEGVEDTPYEDKNW